jgi:hypothetical protein
VNVTHTTFARCLFVAHRPKYATRWDEHPIGGSLIEKAPRLTPRSGRVPAMNRPPRLSRSLRRLAGVALSAALLLGVGSVGSTAAERPDMPGLPLDPQGGQLITPEQTIRTEAKTALQWARVPYVQSVASARFTKGREDLTCRYLRPYQRIEDYSAQIFFVSPPGSDKPFGFSPDFTVRTVAFGSIPVEATLRVAQPRDAEDLPVPLTATQSAVYFCPGLGPNAAPGQVEVANIDTSAVGRAAVEVVKLVVDDVDLDLASTCRSSHTFELQLTAPDIFKFDPSVEPGKNPLNPVAVSSPGFVMRTDHFTFTYGGLLTGDIDIPPFSGCRTRSGEDLSPLLSATVSGPGNPVQVRSTALSGAADGTNPCWKAYTCDRKVSPMPLPERAERP